MANNTGEQNRTPIRARRSTMAVAYDSTMYLFGGIGGQLTESIRDISDDIWKFNTTSEEWSNIPKSDPWPLARRFPGLIGVDTDVYMWGGSGISQNENGELISDYKNDCWRFDLTQERWEKVADTEGRENYPNRRYACMFESVNSDMVLFGGYAATEESSRYLGDTWVWQNSTDWRRIDDEPHSPEPRYAPMTVKNDGAVYMYGGVGSQQYSDIWRFRSDKLEWDCLWTDTEGKKAPSSRYGAALTKIGDELVLFGGRSAVVPTDNYSDLWRFDLNTHRWTREHGHIDSHDYRGQLSRPAYHAKSATARVGTDWYLWGGEGLNGHVSDLWRLDLSTFSWYQVAPARADDPVLW